MHGDVVLPAFELDCRDWIVVDAGTVDLPEAEDTAILAQLSTAAVLDGELYSADGLITVAIVDGAVPPAVPVDAGSDVAELIDAGVAEDEGGGTVARYIAPAPDSRLALLAEFQLGSDAPEELTARVHALM